MTELSNRDQTTTDIRVRSIIIFLLIQATISIANSYDSSSTKLTHFLQYHFLLDALSISSTFVLLLSITTIALITSALAMLLDGITLFLIITNILNCANIYQSNTCYSTFLQDIIIASILAIVCIFDIFQFFAIEKQRKEITLKMAEKTEHLVLQRRARLLHLWSIPFQLGILIADVILSTETENIESLKTPTFLSLILTIVLASTSVMNKPVVIHILGIIFMVIVAGADVISYIYLSKRNTTYIVYKEWCILTLLVFDLCLLGVRFFIATYNPHVKTFISSETNKLKFSIQKLSNPIKKKT